MVFLLTGPVWFFNTVRYFQQSKIVLTLEPTGGFYLEQFSHIVECLPGPFFFWQMSLQDLETDLAHHVVHKDPRVILSVPDLTGL